jgi:hypothetical protein
VGRVTAEKGQLWTIHSFIPFSAGRKRWTGPHAISASGASHRHHGFRLWISLSPITKLAPQQLPNPADRPTFMILIHEWKITISTRLFSC